MVGHPFGVGRPCLPLDPLACELGGVKEVSATPKGWADHASP